MSFLSPLLLAFIPLFVAIDPPGNLPIYMAMTEDMPLDRRKRLLRAAIFTALAIAIVFLVAGRLVFNFLGITENDFRIGGGIVLLCYAIKDLVFTQDHGRSESFDESERGVVPLGVPLIIGPAALTSIIFLTDSQGFWVTLIALILNLSITWALFANSQIISKVIGRGGSRAFAKVASLFLAAIAITLIRTGITSLLLK